jgi:hypothetical protein
MEELDRKLQDSLSYSETFAALLPASSNTTGRAVVDRPGGADPDGHTHFPKPPALNLYDLISFGDLINAW